MQRPDDDMLMAFADNALDPSERQRIDSYLKTDPSARARVEEFRRTTHLARAAVDAPLREAPPRHLVHTILAHRNRETETRQEGSQAELPSVKVVDIAIARRRSRVQSLPRLAGIAASIALLVGVASGFMAARLTAPGATYRLAAGNVPASSGLASALEGLQSGTTQDGITLVASFRDRLQRPCREFEIASETQPNVPEVAAVACRAGGKAWTVEGIMRLAAPTAASGFEPSGINGKDALDALLNVLGASPALTAPDEKEMIAKGWK